MTANESIVIQFGSADRTLPFHPPGVLGVPDFPAKLFLDFFPAGFEGKVIHFPEMHLFFHVVHNTGNPFKFSKKAQQTRKGRVFFVCQFNLLSYPGPCTKMGDNRGFISVAVIPIQFFHIFYERFRVTIEFLCHIVLS